MAAFEIPDHYHQQFTNNVELLLQQKMPKLAGTVSMASYSGEAGQVVKQFGEVEFEDRLTRNEDTTFSDIQHKQRWVYPNDYDLALPVDKIDEIRMLDSPLSPYVEAMRAAYARKWDDEVIGAFFADSKTGKNGGTTTAFDTNNVVAVNHVAPSETPANSGLTVEKLIKVREMMRAAEIDLSVEMPHVGVSAKQISDLLREVKVTSADYAGLKRLEAGEVDTFMGFRFVQSERYQVDSNSYRRLPVWVPSGVHLGTWEGLSTRIGERADKKYITQVYMDCHMGATRTQEGKVYEIKCSEA